MPPDPTRARRPPARRANDLDGAEWTRSSISVWSDIRKTREEMALGHPALFPAMLVERLIRCFTRETQTEILDPFCGSGSTLVAARCLGRHGIGFEISTEYLELARRRLQEVSTGGFTLHPAGADRIPELLPEGSVDFCVTSPPYWDILARKRTADYREIRDYEGADENGDLSRVGEYAEFLDRLSAIFSGVCRVLRPGAYCVVNVMDLRKKSRFYPLHADLAARLSDPERGAGYVYDDLIVWDRRAEYNYLRPLGYPAVFRVNKVHEFLLIFRKPV